MTLPFSGALYTLVTTSPKFFFLIKPTRRTNFPNFILSRNSICFGYFLCPSSGVFYCTFDIGIYLAGLMTASKQGQDIPSCHQTCKKYTNVECTVENSWWWTKEMPETCRVFLLMTNLTHFFMYLFISSLLTGIPSSYLHRLIIPDDVLIQFDLLMMSIVMLETCREVK
jgi:hypothetical protein